MDAVKDKRIEHERAKFKPPFVTDGPWVDDVNKQVVCESFEDDGRARELVRLLNRGAKLEGALRALLERLDYESSRITGVADSFRVGIGGAYVAEVDAARAALERA